MSELLIGCGSSRERKLGLEGTDPNQPWKNLVTVDMELSHNPTWQHDLCHIPYPMFSDNQFEEIHAYDVLEHLGQQGDFRFFFALWSEFWRILRPGGLFFGISPSLSSRWLWGDPGHTRTIQLEHLVFLDQTEYKKQVGVTPMSDYRNYYQADFERVALADNAEQFCFVLRAAKPSRL